MSEFKINEQLMQDCHKLGTLKSNHILLMNNSLVPWIIIVPEVNVIEFFDIEETQQQTILQQINQLSKFIKSEYKVDKINVATIGNVVKQMHIHVVGRFENDYCWPGVVWGESGKEFYADSEVLKIKQNIQSKIENFKSC